MTSNLRDLMNQHRNYLVGVALERGMNWKAADAAVEKLFAGLQRPGVRLTMDDHGVSRAWLVTRLRLQLSRPKWYQFLLAPFHA